MFYKKNHYLCKRKLNCVISCAKLLKMVETIILTVLIIAICLALLSVKVLFKKKGEFTSQHIHDSAAMRKLGIHCVIDQDREARQNADKAEEIKNKINN